MTLYDPYENTVTGADGKRYANDDPNIPTVPPTSRGTFARSTELGVVSDRVAGIDSALTRTVANAVLNSTTTLTSSTAAFTNADVGAKVVGSGIPDDTTIASITSATSVVLSAAATISGTGKTVSFTQDAATVVAAAAAASAVGQRSVTDAALNSTTTVTSASASFTKVDIGATVVGTGIPAGTTIASVTNSTTVVLSAAATITGTGKRITLVRSWNAALNNHETRLLAGTL